MSFFFFFLSHFSRPNSIMKPKDCLNSFYLGALLQPVFLKMCLSLSGSWTYFVCNILIVLLLMVRGFDMDVWVMFGFWHELRNLTELILTSLYHHQSSGLELEARHRTPNSREIQISRGTSH